MYAWTAISQSAWSRETKDVSFVGSIEHQEWSIRAENNINSVFLLLGIIWYKYWSFHHPEAKSYTYYNTFLILCLSFLFQLFFPRFSHIFSDLLVHHASCYPLELTVYICTGIRLRRKSYVFIVFSFFRFPFRNFFVFLFIYFALSELNKPYLNNFHNSIFIVLEAGSVCYVCIQFSCRNAGVQLSKKRKLGERKKKATRHFSHSGYVVRTNMKNQDNASKRRG